MGTRLKLAYFDQHRRELDPEKTVRENMTDGSDYVTVQGRSRHVIGYLKDFLFPPQRIDSPVQALSGGERNRLLLAKIFTQSANMLVLDEPTNDLDVETLELLEELLADYQGTLLLVSHDRTFLDNVVTSTLVFEGEGKMGEYAGGYEDWLRQSAAAPPREAARHASVPRACHCRSWRRPTMRIANSRTKNSASWKHCRKRSKAWKRNRRSYIRSWAMEIFIGSRVTRSLPQWIAWKQ